MRGISVAAVKYNVKDLFGTGPDDPGMVRADGRVEVTARGERIAVIVSPEEYRKLENDEKLADVARSLNE